MKTIKNVQIPAADLPDYYNDCKSRDVMPLMYVGSGWVGIDSIFSDLEAAVPMVSMDVASEFGTQSITRRPYEVVHVAIYETQPVLD